MIRMPAIGHVLLLMTAVEAAPLEDAARSAVIDKAGLFSVEAVRQAEEALGGLSRDKGWQVVVETVGSLNGQDLAASAIAEVQSRKVHGLCILMSRDEKTLFVTTSRTAEKAFPKARVEAIRDRFLSSFREGKFDEGLLAAIAEIRGAPAKVVEVAVEGKGVIDKAGLFSAEAVRQAEEAFGGLRRDKGWQAVVETVDSLDGRNLEVSAIDEARSRNIRGLFVFIAKRETKIYVIPSRSAEEAFPKVRIEAIRDRFVSSFREGKFDEGLLAAVAEIRGAPALAVRAVGETVGDAGKDTLRVLAIGINDYPDKRLKLECATPDARRGQAFQVNSRRLFRTVEVRQLLDAQATRKNILEGLRWLAVSAKPGDRVVVYYAGHGDCKIEGEFYLIPFDVDLRKLRDTGISGEDLKTALGDLACPTVLMLDACYAGSLDQTKRKTRVLPLPADTVVHDLAHDCGLVVMCGAWKEQEAVEENGHGFFTRALVEGMEGKADINKDGQVELFELQAYVNLRVRELSMGDQEPTISIPSVIRSFPLSQP